MDRALILVLSMPPLLASSTLFGCASERRVFRYAGEAPAPSVAPDPDFAMTFAARLPLLMRLVRARIASAHAEMANAAQGPAERLLHARASIAFGGPRDEERELDDTFKRLASVHPRLTVRGCPVLSKAFLEAFDDNAGPTVPLSFTGNCQRSDTTEVRPETYTYEVTEVRQERRMVQQMDIRTRPRFCHRPENLCYLQGTAAGTTCITNLVSYICGEETYEVPVFREEWTSQPVRSPRTAVRQTRVRTIVVAVKGTLAGRTRTRPVDLRIERNDAAYETPEGKKDFAGFNFDGAAQDLVHNFSELVDEFAREEFVPVAQRELQMALASGAMNGKEANFQALLLADVPEANAWLKGSYGFDRATFLRIVSPRQKAP